MLAYAAHRRTVAGRRPAPHALLVIIVAHIAAIAAVMSARMVVPAPPDEVTEIEFIRTPPPPPPQPQPEVPPNGLSKLDQLPVIVPVPSPTPVALDPTPIPSDAPVIQPRIVPEPTPSIAAKAPVRVAARFATPASDIKPPYPPSRAASGAEAVLRLRLAIDERGRVVAVEPIGGADPAFLTAARQHLLARWRYKPATEDGRAVAFATQVSLRFKLED